MSITAANASLWLTSAVSYPTPVKIQQFAVDEAFAAAAVKIAEIVMGVDGKKSAGYTPYLVPLKISLMADSVSMPIFDDLFGSQNQALELEEIDITLSVPGVGVQFTFTNGDLESGNVIPDAGKVLKKRDFEFKFESMSAIPLPPGF